MTARDQNKPWLAALGATATVLFLTVVVMARSAVAGDSSYRRIVKELRSEFGGTEQSLYGAGVMGELAVALIRPAGVSNMNFTILRDLGGSRKTERDFNRVVRSAVDAKWRPLVMYSSPAQGEWTYVYAQPDGSHIKLLIATRARTDAVVAELRINPDKLAAFIDSPEILGVSVGRARF